MTQEDALKIFSNNANTIFERKNALQEQLNITLSALAKELIRSSSDIPQNTLKHFSYLSGAKYPQGKIILLHELLKNKDTEKLLKESASLPSERNVSAGSHGKIAFVKNEYNLLAFDIFNKDIPHAKPVTFPSFSEACISVSDGECEFCILPIQNSRDGKLLSFYSLLDKYDLKIYSVCGIEDEQSRSVLYGLISKELCFSQKGFKGQERLLLEFSLIFENGEFMRELLDVANEIGAVLLNFNFCPVSYDANQNKYFFTFDVPTTELLTLVCYLAFEYHSYTTIGFYKKT